MKPVLHFLLFLTITSGCISENNDPVGSGENFGEATSELTGVPNCYYPVNCVSSPYQSFYWTAVSGAVNYRIVMWKYVNGQEQYVFNAYPVGTSATPPFSLDPFTLYRWKVKGEGAGGADPGPYCGDGVGKYVYYSPYGCHESSP